MWPSVAVMCLRLQRQISQMSALGHKRTFCDWKRCPVYPRKQTWIGGSMMSGKCQKRKRLALKFLVCG